ncbi:hypothetical protein A2U01_0047751, partial [Trifolium medium]|nr:hypothetical protein [Trifolium medium]
EKKLIDLETNGDGVKVEDDSIVEEKVDLAND